MICIPFTSYLGGAQHILLLLLSAPPPHGSLTGNIYGFHATEEETEAVRSHKRVQPTSGQIWHLADSGKKQAPQHSLRVLRIPVAGFLACTLARLHPASYPQPRSSILLASLEHPSPSVVGTYSLLHPPISTPDTYLCLSLVTRLSSFDWSYLTMVSPQPCLHQASKS